MAWNPSAGIVVVLREQHPERRYWHKRPWHLPELRQTARLVRTRIILRGIQLQPQRDSAKPTRNIWHRDANVFGPLSTALESIMLPHGTGIPVTRLMPGGAIDSWTLDTDQLADGE